MPYEMVMHHAGCPAERPVGVVKVGEEARALGCHADEASAQRQIAALYAQERESSAETAATAEWAAPNGIVQEGTLTGDGRMFEPGSLTWEDPAATVVPLRWQPTDLRGHEGAVLVGRITQLARDGHRITARGLFDLGSEAGQEAARLVGEGFAGGVSVDVDMIDGETVEHADGSMVDIFTKGRIRAATLVDIPAFAGASIELVDAETPPQHDLAAAFEPCEECEEAEQLAAPGSEPMTLSWTLASWTPTTIAAAEDPIEARVFAPRTSGSAVSTLDEARPPAAYFADPRLARRTGFHVEPADERGWRRVWGHIYGWGECHLGSPPGRCVTVPRGSTARSMFASQDGRGVRCASGELIPTGPVVLSTDHAPTRGPGRGWAAAKSHYDHTGLAFADVSVGEDDHGIWVAGVVRPGTPDEMVYAAEASGVSGDWRPVGGRLELIAVLSVNTPGYPAMVASYEGGELVALIAGAGTLAGDDGCSCHETAPALAALQAALAAQGRELAALRGLTAQARSEAIDALEQAMNVPEAAARIEAALLGG